METHNDFKELLALLNSHNVDYLEVGAFALAHHGFPRFTGDLDILVRPDADNARRITAALKDFGFGSLGLSEEDFTAPEQVIQLGVSPVRVDFLTSLTGVSWKEASMDRTEGTLSGVSVYFLGKNALLRNKRILGRKKDLADLEALGEDADENKG